MSEYARANFKGAYTLGAETIRASHKIQKSEMLAYAN